jgi:hypothetical protein
LTSLARSISQPCRMPGKVSTRAQPVVSSIEVLNRLFFRTPGAPPQSIGRALTLDAVRNLRNFEVQTQHTICHAHVPITRAG